MAILSRAGGGTSPMKPGNRPIAMRGRATVLILAEPAGDTTQGSDR